jgi:hyperosmotically inducible protein
MPPSLKVATMNKRTPILLFAVSLAATLVVAGCSKQSELPATPPASPAIPAAAANVSDLDVTEHVKTALLQNESLKGFDINVVTLKGDVRLSGMVNSQAQIDEALAIARASDGAHTIHNELTIKK